MAEYKSKTVLVHAAPMSLFNRITDVGALLAAVPEEQRRNITVEGDTITSTVSGFTIAVKISEKVPFSKVVIEDVEAPFHFRVTFHFDAAELLSETMLTIEVSADLNFMMKTLLGGKIQEYLDKAVTAISTGQFLG